MLSYFKSSYDRHDFQAVFAYTCSELQQLMQDFVPRKFMERRNIEHVKKDKKDIMSNWPDEKILDRIYQSKLADWQLDALNKLTELTESYSEELEKIKDGRL